MEKIINDQTINQLNDFNSKMEEAVKLGNELNGILNNADEKEEEIEALRMQVVISELNMDSWRSRFKNCEERNKKLIAENEKLQSRLEKYSTVEKMETIISGCKKANDEKMKLFFFGLLLGGVVCVIIELLK